MVSSKVYGPTPMELSRQRLEAGRQLELWPMLPLFPEPSQEGDSSVEHNLASSRVRDRRTVAGSS